MSNAIMKLNEGRENGKLQQIKDKWWKTDKCEKQLESSVPDVDRDYVVCFFVFLGGGCFVALILAIIEYVVRMVRSK